MEKYLTLNSILQMLSGLSDSNKKWIADKLYESVSYDKKADIETEREATLSAFRQVKALREGKLDTRPVTELLNEY